MEWSNDVKLAAFWAKQEIKHFDDNESSLDYDARRQYQVNASINVRFPKISSYK